MVMRQNPYFYTTDVANHEISEVSLWTFKSPTYSYYLTSDKKATTDPMIFRNKLLEIKEQ